MKVRALEIVRSAVSRQECEHLGDNYLFHIDRLYLNDDGCLGRLVLCGFTWELWPSEVDLSWSAMKTAVGDTIGWRVRFALSVLVGIAAIPSRLLGGAWDRPLDRFARFAGL